MPRGYYFSKDYHDRNMANILEARLTPEAVGILYLLRCMAGNAQRQGRVLVDGKLAKRPAVLSYLKRQFGQDVAKPLSELFERGFLSTVARDHIVVNAWKEDQADTPAAKRKRREREKNQTTSTQEGSVETHGLNTPGVKPVNPTPSACDSHRTVTGPSRTDIDQDQEKMKIKSELPGTHADARASLVVLNGRGVAPPFPGAPLGSDSSETDGAEQREQKREENREQGEGSESREARRGAPGKGGDEDWQTVDIYLDPFHAAHVVCGEWSKDFSSTCRNAIRDLGNSLFSQAISEVRQERMGGNVRSPGRLFNGILDRYRRESGMQERKSRSMQA